MKQPNNVRALTAQAFNQTLQRLRSMISIHGNNLEVVDILKPGSDSQRNLLADIVENFMKHCGHQGDSDSFSKNRRVANKVSPKLRGDGVS